MNPKQESLKDNKLLLLIATGSSLLIAPEVAAAVLLAYAIKNNKETIRQKLTDFWDGQYFEGVGRP